MKYCLTLLFTLSSLLSFSQNDEIKGHVKSIREKVIFKKYEKKVEEFVDDDGNVIRRTYLPDLGISNSLYGEHFTYPKIILETFPKKWYFTHFAGYKNYYRKFSKTGKVILEKWYEHDGEILDTIEYKYDKNDSLILKTEKRYYTNLEERFYNKSGLDSIMYYLKDDYEINTQKVKFTYNDDLKVIRHDFFRDSLYESSTLYKYNDIGSIIEESVFLPLEKININKIKKVIDISNFKGDYIINFENIYDENNRIIQSNKYKTVDRKAILKSTTYYKYNDNNLLVQTKGYHLNKVSTREIEYKNSLLINERFFWNENPPQLKSFFYDNDNYLVKAIIKDREETFNIEFKYKFDRKGNWNKQTKYVNGVPTYELIREIEYY